MAFLCSLQSIAMRSLFVFGLHLLAFLCLSIGNHGENTRMLDENPCNANTSKPGHESCLRQTKIQNGRIFREYIGDLYNGVSFTDVPINENVEFHFILSFAIDYTSDGLNPTNGQFNVFWDSNLDPQSVTAIKARHGNVKVMVSLGGDTANGNSPAEFNPTSVSSWVSNAVSSLTDLIQTYNLDGIDIDYEHFDYSNHDEFVSCIGLLISELKQNNVISVASIAPFDGVDDYYTALWGQYSNVIDYVNYQFFTGDPSTSSREYVRNYNQVLSMYDGGNVLASFCTETNVGVKPETALSACRTLQSSGKLPGIYIFSADSSYTSNVMFQYEEEAQALLAQ